LGIQFSFCPELRLEMCIKSFAHFKYFDFQGGKLILRVLKLI
jgi:hypothetical protein